MLFEAWATCNFFIENFTFKENFTRKNHPHYKITWASTKIFTENSPLKKISGKNHPKNINKKFTYYILPQIPIIASKINPNG